MRSLTRRIRVLALVQLLVSLPLTGSSSVCIPLDGTGRAEPGVCGCVLPPVAGAAAGIGSANADDCGPCRDVALNSLRGTARVADLAPAWISHDTLPGGAAPAIALPVAPGAGFTEPPGTRRPILRC